MPEGIRKFNGCRKKQVEMFLETNPQSIGATRPAKESKKSLDQKSSSVKNGAETRPKIVPNPLPCHKAAITGTT